MSEPSYFECPSCRELNEVPKHYLGKNVCCKFCRQCFVADPAAARHSAPPPAHSHYGSPHAPSHFGSPPEPAHPQSDSDNSLGIKKAGYKDLFEWRIANGLPDQWYLNIGGMTAREVYSLDQIAQCHKNSPASVMHVMNLAVVNQSNEEWFTFRELKKADKSSNGVVGCAYIMALFVPVIGLLMGLFMLVNDNTRSEAIGVIATSVLFMLIYTLIIIACQ